MEDSLYPDAFPQPFAASLYDERYKHPEDVNWTGTTKRVSSVVGALYEAPKAQGHVGFIADLQDRASELIGHKKMCPGGRYLYAAGRDFNQVNNCLLLRCPDSREGWATTSYQAEMALMSGAGIGVWYGDVRAAGAPISRTGGISAGPLPKMGQINDTGKHVLAGGNRRSAIWAGLPWWHPDIFEFITCKDWSEGIKRLKEEDPKFVAPMEGTNISVTLDDNFFAAYNADPYSQADLAAAQTTLGWAAPNGGSWHAWARNVYKAALSHMLRHGEPGFTIDTGPHAGEVLRNACTEITSADDSDVCNLGHLVLPRFDSPEEFGSALRDLMGFLTAGSVYSEVPYAKVRDVRELNRRLGGGIMGVHEFVMKHGARYGSDGHFELLEPYAIEYSHALDYAHEIQSMLGLSLSKGATAIAPTGTTGALMETTPGNCPMYTAAEIRKIKVARASGDDYENHVVVDPVAQRLVAEGVDPSLIEDAYSISLEPERRLRAQAFLQKYTDHAISSTVNIMAPITELPEIEDFGNTLMEYLPDLRGVTVYPDGARAGQPRKPCDLEWALENEGTVFAVNEESCVGGLCGV